MYICVNNDSCMFWYFFVVYMGKNSTKVTSSSKQESEIPASTQHEAQVKIREPTGRIMRRNWSKMFWLLFKGYHFSNK